MADLARGELATEAQEVIDECRTRFTFCQTADGHNRQEFVQDKRFVGGDQWDPTIRDERFGDRRPALTVNITDSICRRIVNSCRENRPRILTHPVGNGASIQTSKVYNGLIRHIEVASNADFAYDTGVENSVHGGFGWLGVDAEYVSDNSFDQDLRIIGWTNPLMCYGDPNSRMPDGSDMDFFLETQYMKRAEYRLRWGSMDEGGWKYAGSGDDVPDWSNKEEIRICKYWRVERKKDELFALADGRIGFRSEIDTTGTQIRGRRTVYRKQVRAYLLTAFKVLSTQDWPGKWIPRVPIYGRRIDLDGRMTLKGMVRELRHPAIIYNYARTKETETYALQPNAQWVGPENFTEGYEADWRDANRKPIVALRYKMQYGDNGEPLPPPQRLDPPAVNQGFAAWAEGAKSDFLHVAGMPHDPDIDKKGEVISGLALKRRQGLADVSNFDFYDNLTRALRHMGRIIVDLIPHYYDTQRIIRIIQEDGTPEQVMINQPTQVDPITQAVLKIEHDMTVGDYEVVVDTGPSYQTKREESAEALLEVLGTPLGQMAAQAAGDKILRQFDFADADGIADRLMGMIPAAQAEAMPGLDPKAKAIIGALQQQLQAMQKQLMAAHLEIHDKKGIEDMRQKGETQRTHMREIGATEREIIKSDRAAHDTATDAVTRHDVAEINAWGKIVDTQLDHHHDARMAEREMEHASQSQDRELTHDAMKTERTLESAERTASRRSAE